MKFPIDASEPHARCATTRLPRVDCANGSAILRWSMGWNMFKPERPGEQLRAMVQVRLNTQPEVQRRIADNPRSAPIVGPVAAHERDARGRSWNIVELQGGYGLERTFRAIVDSLRDAYDLA